MPLPRTDSLAAAIDALIALGPVMLALAIIACFFCLCGVIIMAARALSLIMDALPSANRVGLDENHGEK